MEFARYELNKYAALMGFEVDITLSVDIPIFDTSRFFKFNAKFDDAFEIKVTDGKGTIKATNERAVLIGVYHFFKCQGCRFLRPGRDGELIPRKDKACDVNETWYAKVRHRGVTDMAVWGVEDGIDNVVDYLDWLPKMAMNTYFIELEDTYPTMQDRYSAAGIHLSHETFSKGHDIRINELKKRHLIYHNAGHGWTIRMMDGIERISFSEDLTPCKNPEILALTDGKRQIFRNKPMWTNLCYSQKKVRKDMAQLVYDYSVKHPETDAIHFWCADYFGNWCQCDECKKKRPSDWYVMILNEIDKIFTEHGNTTTKIVFLVYFELAYAPLFERLLNPDRFIMMFAPYGRDFRQSYRDAVPTDYAPKLCNDFDYKYMDMSLYLKQLEEWQKVFKGDSFTFDYVFYANAYYERMCQVNHSPVLYLDSVDIKHYGLNGKIECGNGRAMTPTAFSYHAVFTELFYNNTNYDDLYSDYFESSYGKDQKVSEFLRELAALLPDDFMSRKKSELSSTDILNIKTALEKISAFKTGFENYLSEERTQRRNCRLFREFIRIIYSYFKMLDAKANGTDIATRKAMLSDFKAQLSQTEAICTNYLCTSFMYERIEPQIL